VTKCHQFCELQTLPRQLDFAEESREYSTYCTVPRFSISGEMSPRGLHAWSAKKRRNAARRANGASATKPKPKPKRSPGQTKSAGLEAERDRGPWTSQRALERYRVLCESFRLNEEAKPAACVADIRGYTLADALRAILPLGWRTSTGMPWPVETFFCTVRGHHARAGI
jgi:hypothetical protein